MFVCIMCARMYKYELIINVFVHIRIVNEYLMQILIYMSLYNCLIIIIFTYLHFFVKLDLIGRVMLNLDCLKKLLCYES